MNKNWIITDKGDAINLDFVSKIMYGTRLHTPNDQVVMIFHGIGGAATGTPGATLKYTYESADAALAAYNKLVATLSANGVSTSLVQELNNVAAVNGTTVVSTAGSTKIMLSGSNLEFGGTITIGGNSLTILERDSISIVGFAPAHAAGLVDVVFTDLNGVATTLTNSLTYA